MNHKKTLGQYFTISERLQQFVFDIVKNKSSSLLEPSFGAGHLLKKFKEYDENYPMVCHEIDENVIPVINFNKFQKVIYGNFINCKTTQKFKTIVGNPPYVKQSKGNLYIKFIEVCFDLLEDDGELVFIVPSDFIKLTSASRIINKMVEHGSFTDFLFPHDEKLFEGANIDVMIFRYEKGLRCDRAVVNGEDMFCNVSNGIVTFNKSAKTGSLIGDTFNVYVGLVSGKDEVYRASFGNIELLGGDAKETRFIFPEKFPTGDVKIDEHLEAHKSELLKRKIKNFTERNWFEWGAPRNISSIREHWGKPCIYVKNMTRNKNVAFIGKVQYFGGSLLCLIPKNNVDLETVTSYINSDDFKKDYMYAERFKIGHKQISSAIVPISQHS